MLHLGDWLPRVIVWMWKPQRWWLCPIMFLLVDVNSGVSPFLPVFAPLSHPLAVLLVGCSSPFWLSCCTPFVHHSEKWRWIRSLISKRREMFGRNDGSPVKGGPWLSTPPHAYYAPFHPSFPLCAVSPWSFDEVRNCFVSTCVLNFGTVPVIQHALNKCLFMETRFRRLVPLIQGHIVYKW